MDIVKELYKRSPVTAVAVAIVVFLIANSLPVSGGSMITKAMVQAGWCSAKDYVCLVERYASISLLVILAGITVDGIVKLIQWLSHRRNLKAQEIRNENLPKPLPIEDAKSSKVRDRFCFHLDAIMKDLIGGKIFQISGNGRTFLERIKKCPPFLGLDCSEPVISPGLEKRLTEHFQAVDFKEKYAKFIRGGERYTVTDTDTTWKIISKKAYGSVKFANMLKHNFSMPKPRTGMVIILPYIDTSGNLGFLSEEEIKDKYLKATYDWIRQDIVFASDEQFLTSDETWPLLRAFYDAAKRTLEQEQYRDNY